MVHNKITFFDEKPIVSLLVLFLSFLVIALSPKIDIYVSNLFFDNNHFIFKNNIFYNFIDKYFPYILLIIFFVIFLLWFLGFVNSKKWILNINTRAMMFLCGTMFVGPFLIVNGLFKSFWGRARPKNIVEFGGDKNFSPAMVISDQCSWDCSFVSGHTSIAFWLVAIALVAPKKYRKPLLLLTFIIGFFTALARVAQGYHFFSDVFFASVITVYVIWLFYYYIYEQKKQ